MQVICSWDGLHHLACDPERDIVVQKRKQMWLLYMIV